jgi:hypothetical protein
MVTMLTPTSIMSERRGTQDSVGRNSLRSVIGVEIPDALRRLNVDSRRGISTPSGSLPLAFSLRGFVSE